MVGALAVAVLSLATVGCSRSGDIDESATPTTDRAVAPARNAGRVPAWITEGIALARQRQAASRPLTRPQMPGTTVPSSLPPKGQVVSLLTAAGVSATAANCIYDSVAEGAVSDDAASLLRVLANPPTSAADVGSITALRGLDEASVKRLLVALAPCLDSQTLVTLVGATGGLGALGAAGAVGGAAGGSNASIAALLGTLASSGGKLPGGIDAGQLAGLAGVNLPPAQQDQLKALLAGLAVLDPNKLDVSKLDFKNLSPQQIFLLLNALAAGLTGQQKQDLNAIAKVDLSRLDLQIDPDKLSPEKAGALIVVLLPFLAQQIRPPDGSAPPGVDPGQIYVPPGLDLSAINPLYFVREEDLVLGLTREGVSADTASCLYQKLRLIDPRAIGLAFTGSDLSAASQILVSIIQCVAT